MLNFTLRRLMFTIPTLLLISFIIFIVLDLARMTQRATCP